MGWFNRASVQEEVNNRDTSIGDPAFADVIFAGNQSWSGENVTEQTALNVAAVFRAVNIIAGTIASLPLRSILTLDDGTKDRANSWLDNPSGSREIGPTQFEWVETLVWHLVLHGNAYIYKLRNGAGAVSGGQIIPPGAITPELDNADNKVFRVTLANGSQALWGEYLVMHIPAPITDGLRGLSLLECARNGIGISLAADKASGRVFKNGASYSVLVTADEDITTEEAETIKASLQSKMVGVDTAGGMAVVNRKLTLTPWTMSLADAQWLETRQFQIEEIARWFGIPPHLLMQSEKSTSWGTGIEEQNRGLARHTLSPWTARIEQRLSRLLPNPQKAEFDYSGYLKPSPKDEIDLLIQQVNAGLLTINEARAIRNMPKLPASTGADLPRVAPGSTDPRLVENELEGKADETDPNTQASG